MNRDQEVGNSGRTQVSPRQKLEDAIQEYLESVQQEENSEFCEDPGLLVGWYVVMEQQNPVTGKSRHRRVVREYQSLNTTLGLITYSDAYYRARVAKSV